MEREKTVRFSLDALDGLACTDGLAYPLGVDIRKCATNRALADIRDLVTLDDVIAAIPIVMARFKKEPAPEPAAEPEPAEPVASSEPIATADQAAEVAYGAVDVLMAGRTRSRCGDAMEVSPFVLDRVLKDLKDLGRWAEGRARAEAERVGPTQPKYSVGHVYKRIGEIMERLDETLSRNRPRTAGADAYRSLAALRGDLRRSTRDG